MNDDPDNIHPPVPDEHSAPAPGRFREPAGVPASHALAWIIMGWEYFKKEPTAWIVVTIIWVGGSLLLSMLPLASILVNLIFPVLVAGMMLGCAAIERGETFLISHLFAGFRLPQSGRLITLGAVNIAITLVAIMLIGVFFSLLLGSSADIADPQELQAAIIGDDSSGLLLLLLLAALLLPVMMAFWFAPLLIAIDNRDVIDSLKLSFTACLRNIWPLLVYGLLFLPLFILSVLLMGLGFLVVIPMIYASLYASYKDIFHEG
ncbi:MAG: BPSS1780 family membrane protein [Pseudomonadota bacterium]